MQCLAFILMRRDLPHIERPYRSPLGVPGAVVAIVIAAITFIFLFLNPSYRFGVIGVAIWYAIAVFYFAVAGRHRLVRSPEEEFALVEREKAKAMQASGTGPAGK